MIAQIFNETLQQNVGRSVFDLSPLELQGKKVLFFVACSNFSDDDSQVMFKIKGWNPVNESSYTIKEIHLTDLQSSNARWIFFDTLPSNVSFYAYLDVDSAVVGATVDIKSYVESVE